MVHCHRKNEPSMPGFEGPQGPLIPVPVADFCDCPPPTYLTSVTILLVILYIFS